MAAVSLVVFGGRGSGLFAVDTVRRQAGSGVAIVVAGFLNDFEPPGSAIGDVPVLGPFGHWRALAPETRFAAPLHKVGEMARRIDRIESLRIPPERWFPIADPTAVIGQGCRIGTGVILGPHAVVKAMTTIGDHVAIRDGASIGHDAVLEDYAFVAANAAVGGYCRIGRGAFVGMGATIRENVAVGPLATVGMGAVVVKDIGPGETVVGNPARSLPSGGRSGDETA